MKSGYGPDSNGLLLLTHSFTDDAPDFDALAELE